MTYQLTVRKIIEHALISLLIGGLVFLILFVCAVDWKISLSIGSIVFTVINSIFSAIRAHKALSSNNQIKKFLHRDNCVEKVKSLRGVISSAKQKGFTNSTAMTVCYRLESITEDILEMSSLCHDGCEEQDLHNEHYGILSNYRKQVELRDDLDIFNTINKELIDHLDRTESFLKKLR